MVIDMIYFFKKYLVHFLFFIFFICACSSSMPSTADGDIKPTVILISIDGFHADYLDKYPSPHLEALAQDGVRATSMIPVFPSLTFPSHYSMVTGLYPEHHGIVSNSMNDPQIGKFALSDQTSVEDSRWWGGEPLWVTVQKSGQKSGTLFWPGSATKIVGKFPNYYRKYEKGLAYSKRVQQILQWLDLPAKDRPTFLTLYFEAVDSAGHAYGPESSQVKKAVARVDRAIGGLMRGLRERKIFGSVNLIIVSDHGMSAVDPKNVITISDHISLKDVDVRVSGATLVGLEPELGKQEEIFQALKKASPHLQVYHKSEIPLRFHFQVHSRIPEIMAFADEGWIVQLSHFNPSGKALRGMHGYDNELSSMAALFLAHGPAFKNGVQIKEFLNIHIYPLILRLLSVQPAANDAADFNPMNFALQDGF